ncbi:MAG: hypothetical protein WA918_06370, partial [Erythrobacter sp.]
MAALIFGGGPERLFAATWLIFFEATAFVHELVAGDYRYAQIDLALASSDAIAAIVWIAIALYANRNYPFWISG